MKRPDLDTLVVPGRNKPSLYTVNGRPLYVHLNGFAIVLLKYVIKAKMRSRKCSTEVKLPRFRPTVCLDVTSLAASSYEYDSGTSGPTRCAVIGAALDDRYRRC
jgi:hypothetical protein